MRRKINNSTIGTPEKLVAPHVALKFLKVYGCTMLTALSTAAGKFFPVLGPLNPVHVLISCFFNVYFNIILPFHT